MTTANRTAFTKEVVQSINVISGGSGYTNGSSFTVTAGGNVTGQLCQGTISVSGGVITAFNLTAGGNQFGGTGTGMVLNILGGGSGVSVTYTMKYLDGLFIVNSDNNRMEHTYGNTWHTVADIDDIPNRIVASGDLTAQTTAPVTVAGYTVGASNETITIQGQITVNSISSSTIGLQAIWTDENGLSKNATFFQQGFTTTGISAAGTTTFPPLPELTCISGSTVTLRAVFITGSTANFNAHGSILKVR
jgi:hypothetical protein